LTRHAIIARRSMVAGEFQMIWKGKKSGGERPRQISEVKKDAAGFYKGVRDQQHKGQRGQEVARRGKWNRGGGSGFGDWKKGVGKAVSYC